MASKASKTTTDTPRYTTSTNMSRPTLTSAVARATLPNSSNTTLQKSTKPKNTSSSNNNTQNNNNESNSENQDNISTHLDSTESFDLPVDNNINNNTHSNDTNKQTNTNDTNNLLTNNNNNQSSNNNKIINDVSMHDDHRFPTLSMSLTHSNISNNTSHSFSSSPTLSSSDYSTPGFSPNNNTSPGKDDSNSVAENDRLRREIMEMKTMIEKVIKQNEQTQCENQLLRKTMSNVRKTQLLNNLSETMQNIDNYHIDDESDNDNDDNSNHEKSSKNSNKHVSIKNEPQNHPNTYSDHTYTSTDLRDENTDDQKYSDTGENNDVI